MNESRNGWLVMALLLSTGCVVDEIGSLANQAGSGPIDQQQPNHPFVSGGYTCFLGQTGGMAQGVTPAVRAWEVVSLYLFATQNYPGDQTVSIEIRDGATDGPALAAATATVPEQDTEGGWFDFTFSPPVTLTPGAPVFIFADIDDRVAWHTDRTTADPYPAGSPFGLCGSVTFDLSPGDFTFITYAPATTDPDGDGDGLPDAEDPSTVADAVDALPGSSFHAPGHRSAIDAKLADAEAALLAGDTEEARSILEHLRDHVDGCEATGAADRNDWISDCDDQDAIRALIDGILTAL